MKRMKRIFITTCLIIFFLSALAGCELVKTGAEKIKDLDYTVCDESRLPAELAELINEKKKEPFKLTYRTKDYLYIAVGYGAQDRADLNVKMKELYLTKNAIYVDTALESAGSATLENNLVSYPWIAAKCQLYDLQVNFR